MLALQKLRPEPGLVLREIADIDRIAADEVLIRTLATGVCGTDVHIANWTPGYESMQRAMPVTIGHEFAGTIVKAGAAIVADAIGMRVTVRPSVLCGTCAACVAGDDENCTGRRGIGIGRHGGFAPYVAVPFANCLAIPDALDAEVAAMTEPMTVCAEAVDNAEVKPGDRVLVTGGRGSIGQGIALFAEAAGASQVVICGRDDAARFATLHALGFADTVDLAGTTMAEGLKPFLAQGLFDAVIEATGAPAIVQEAMQVLKKRGILVIAGIHPRPASVDLTQLVRQHQQIRGSYRAPLATWPRVIAYLAANQERARRMITHRVALADAEAGFAQARLRLASKVIVRHAGQD